MKFFTDDEWREDQYINGGCVLEENSVGGGGVFGRPDEEEQQYRVNERTHQAEGIYSQTVATRDNQDRNSGQQRTEECDLIGVEICREFDEHPARAPEQHGKDDEQDGWKRLLFF